MRGFGGKKQINNMETTTETKPKRTRTPKVTPTTAEAWTKRDFGIIAKMFEAETAEVQARLIAVSGMLQVIKLNLGEAPLVISYLIKKSVTLSESDILVNLQVGAIGVTLADKLPGETLPEFLTSLSAFASSNLSHPQYNSFWHGMFCAISAPLLPWSKIVVYSEYVYQVLVKPNVK